jgi:predicted ATPase
LARELSRGFGLGGRARRSGSAIERARVNVRRRITLALRRIRAASPELGAGLESRVKTGIFCVYMPGSRTPP